MVHLLQLITTLLFLSHAEVEAVQRELVPASLKVWKLMGAEANFMTNVAKITTNSENLGCNQTESGTNVQYDGIVESRAPVQRSRGTRGIY
ncbi:hypothetical protein OESDEN_10447 [Oesophagostomum dentatum]|uniref:Secreted protein n=1 Tax=Oesophagostomum dentatum TaxID=61180 RepID=A0A0B1T2W8_OESDE|nr:hypothetical protein OESDEN_10447 [Oesophagostomum dentatum]